MVIEIEYICTNFGYKGTQNTSEQNSPKILG